MSEPPPSLLLWIRRPPHSTVHLSEAVRVASMAAAFDRPVRLLFLAEGVRALVRGQEPYRLAPPLGRTLAGIVTPDAPALVHRPSLECRGLGPERLVEGLPVRFVDDAESADWLYRAGRVVPF